MTTHNPLPYDMSLIQIKKEDLHYIQRAARRANKHQIDFLHDIIEKHRRPGEPGQESGTKIKTPAAAAGVICPKDTGEMDPDISCKECEHFQACYSSIMGALL